MVSWTMRTARSLSSAGCRCPDPCLGVCCFDAAMGYILPKNAASIKPRAVQRDAQCYLKDSNCVDQPRGQLGADDLVKVKPRNGVAPASLQTVVTPRRDPDSPL